MLQIFLSGNNNNTSFQIYRFLGALFGPFTVGRIRHLIECKRLEKPPGPEKELGVVVFFYYCTLNFNMTDHLSDVFFY